MDFHSLDKGQEFYLVPLDKSFRDAFAGITILEYPVFHVLFPADLSKYKIVNLPLLTLPPWKAPESRRDSISEESKRVKLDC